MLKRIKQPQPKLPVKAGFTYSPHQLHCLRALTHLKEDRLGLGRGALLSLMGLSDEFSMIAAVDKMLTSADFSVSTYRDGLEPGVISVSASYKNYRGYKLPWTETHGDKPVMYYKHSQLWVSVAVCFLTLCLRTDKKLWLTDCEPSVEKPTPRLLRPKLKRIKKGATRN